MDTFVEETEGFQSSEEIPETQVCSVGGQISVEGGQRGGLDFDDHMAQLQQGRSRYKFVLLLCISVLLQMKVNNAYHKFWVWKVRDLGGWVEKCWHMGAKKPISIWFQSERC